MESRHVVWLSALVLVACGDSENGSTSDSIGGPTATSVGTSSATETETSTTMGSGSSAEGTSSTSSTTEADTGSSGTSGTTSTTGNDTGSSDGSGSTTQGQETSDSGPKFDLGMQNCLECSITLDSTQSSSLQAINNNTFLGEAILFNEIIYALDDVELGRVIYTGDSNILYEEITDCPLWEWLGDTGMQLPRLLTFGNHLCSGIGNSLNQYPAQWMYAGNNMPGQYLNNAAALKNDYDVVIYCAMGNTYTAAEGQTINDFVQNEGGGLYLVSEYWTWIDNADLTALNDIAGPMDVEFLATNLNWGQANGIAEFECFPDPQ